MKKLVAYLLTICVVFSLITTNALAYSEEKNDLFGKGKKYGHYDSQDLQIIKDLNTYLLAEEKNRNFHGAVLVEREGRVLLRKGFGMADYENETRNNVFTRFPIGSMTKQFVAMAIMQLQEKGKLDVNDKLSKYISDFPRGNEVTLHQLLVHTSGIKSYYRSDFELTNKVIALKKEDRTPENIINIIKNEDYANEPGAVWEYSNTGYLMLGYIVEKVSGTTLEEYLIKNIFKPLKMYNTTASYRNDKQMYNSQGYMGFLENIRVEEDYGLLNLAFGAGYLTSTVLDMYKWSQALETQRLIKKETMDEIFTPHFNLDTGVSYGYGWLIAEGETGKEVYHDGGCFGFNSIISKAVDKNATVIILTNKSPGGQNIYQIKDNLYKIISGERVEIPEAKAAINMDSELLEKYTGEYEYVDYPAIKYYIVRKDNQLYAQMTGQEEYAIYPQSETVFFYKIVEADLFFEKDDRGLITGFILKQNGLELKFKKT